MNVIGLFSIPDDDWTREAVCVTTDPEAFYPDPGTSARAAKAICGTCPVRDKCLEHAIAHEERWGVWGGLSEAERMRLHKGQNPLRGPGRPAGFQPGKRPNGHGIACRCAVCRHVA